FDSVCYSQRARDFGFAMHRMARTYGKQTEKKNDIGTDIKHRAQIFLEEYLKHNLLTDEEIKALPWVIQDEALSRVINVLGEHYLLNDQTWSFDLPKQVTTLREGLLFDF
nr:hypothetical protein [Nanoarchaeota archaeon]